MRVATDWKTISIAHILEIAPQSDLSVHDTSAPLALLPSTLVVSAGALVTGADLKAVTHIFEFGTVKTI